MEWNETKNSKKYRLSESTSTFVGKMSILFNPGGGKVNDDLMRSEDKSSTMHLSHSV